MVTTRPLLYLSLPGLALIIGLIYLRRQKRSREEKKEDRNESANKTVTFGNENIEEVNQTDKAISIKVAKHNNVENSLEFENKLGKSAPINIAHGGKSFMTKFVDNDAVSEDHENIEYRKQFSSLLDKEGEFYLSSIDLPDSPNVKRYTVKGSNLKNIEEPIVIKANINPNTSLSSSFLENKYIEEPEMNKQVEQADNDNILINNPNSTVGNVSPSISEFSAHSGDSGKGSSLPQSERLKIIDYDFILPTSLVGQLCGRKRAYINQIKSKSGANIILRSYTNTNKMKICSLKGTEKEINSALSLIRTRFPLKRYPHLTLQKIEYAEPQTVVQLSLDYTSCLQLRLIEGINNDVIVVSVLSGNHIFVHHPSHPSFPSINVLQDFMNRSYETGEAPSLPELTENAICVAKVENLWYRVQIVTKDHKEEHCLVKFLDYGGYTVIGTDYLKQIRADFMTIPFQATECVLSNVEPIGSEWSQEAIKTLCHLTAGLVLQAQIVRYNSSNIPEINLYAPISKNSVIFINKEMIARGFAK